MRNAPEAGLDEILADLERTLAALHRPPALVEAEERLIDARERRAELWLAYKASIKARNNNTQINAKVDAPVLAAKADVDAAELEIERAKKVLARQRQIYGATIAALVQEHREVAAAAVDRAARILGMAAAVAAKEHTTLPLVVAFRPEIECVILAEAYQARWRQREAADRAVMVAARAITARSRPPTTAAGPITWTGKLSDVVGGPVENQPVLLTPGRSGRTSQKITVPAVGGSYGIAATAPSFSTCALSLLKKRSKTPKEE